MKIFSDLINLFKFDFNISNKIKSILNIEKNNTISNFFFLIDSNVNPNAIIKDVKKQLISNSHRFGLLVQQKIKQHCIPKEQINESLKNPEKIIAISNANKIASLTENETLKDILASLIVQKLITKEDEESIIITKAISVIKNITSNHIRLLALFYLYQKGIIKKWIDKNELEIKQKEYSSLFNLLELENIISLGNTLNAEALVIYSGHFRQFKDYISEFLEEYKIINGESEILSNTELIVQKLYKPIFRASLINRELSCVGEYIAKIYIQNIEQINCVKNKII